MKEILEDLFKMNRNLLGEGYDNAVEYIKQLIDVDIFKFQSGTKVGTWTVPNEWTPKEAWVKYKGKKILDFSKNPLSLVVYSLPFKGTVTLEELKAHLHTNEDRPDDFMYEFKFYERDWGFTIPFNQLAKLKEGDYEVCIDVLEQPGEMKVLEHTIKGKTDREILLFAHLDHPYQANDNLSAVVALIDLVKKVKPEAYDHTIKLVFCPETIGSVAYAITKDISKVDFMMALDIVGNKNEEGILLQKSFDKNHRVNDVAYLAVRGIGKGFRQGIFRSLIGSDEYVFNDPQINIPGLLFTTHPYPQYHTSADTPDLIDYEQIEQVQIAVLKTIEYYEKDFVPVRMFTGPLYRSGFGIQTKGKQLNLSWDYLIYSIDGKKRFSELCVDFGLNFEHTYELLNRLIEEGIVGSRPIVSEEKLKETTK